MLNYLSLFSGSVLAGVDGSTLSAGQSSSPRLDAIVSFNSDLM